MATNTVEEALRTLLKSNPALSGLLGDDVSTPFRCHYDQAPQSPGAVAVSPYVTFEDISYHAEFTVSGGAGCAERRYQFNVFSLDELEMLNIVEAIRLTLVGRAGTFAGVRLWAIQADNAHKLPYDYESKFHSHASDFMVSYAEALA